MTVKNFNKGAKRLSRLYSAVTHYFDKSASYAEAELMEGEDGKEINPDLIKGDSPEAVEKRNKVLSHYMKGMMEGTKNFIGKAVPLEQLYAIGNSLYKSVANVLGTIEKKCSRRKI